MTPSQFIHKNNSMLCKVLRICKVYLTIIAKHTILNTNNGWSEWILKTKIKELRKQRKISQEELAIAVGTTRQTITSIEVEKYTASLPLAYKIAKFFELTIEEVFDFSEIDKEMESWNNTELK